METIGGRLDREVRRWAPRSGQGRGKEGAAKTFQRVMKERLSRKGAGDKAGTSYRAVLAYLSGASEPSVEWLREASVVLNVPLGRLVDGEEEPARADGKRTAAEVFAEAVQVRDGLMNELIRKLYWAQPEGAPRLSDDDFATVERALRTHLLVTRGALRKGGDPTPGGAGGQFEILSLMAMLAAVPEPGLGRPLAVVLKKLPQRVTGSRAHLELPPTQEDIDDE